MSEKSGVRGAVRSLHELEEEYRDNRARLFEELKDSMDYMKSAGYSDEEIHQTIGEEWLEVARHP